MLIRPKSLGRRRLRQIQLVQGPNRILLTLEDLTFINPQLSKKVSSIAVSWRSRPSSRAHLFTVFVETCARFVCGARLTQKITLEDLTESKSVLEDKSADRSHSVNSMQTATHETTNIAVYEVRKRGCGDGQAKQTFLIRTREIL